MNKIDQLWVRACKVIDSNKRLSSVCRRFYMSDCTKEERESCIINILSGLVDKYNPMRTFDILSEMNKTTWFVEDERTYNEKAISMLTHRIAFTHKDKLTGLSSPCRFKNKGE